MGYTTDFWGEFTIIPALTKEHRKYLEVFAYTRRMKRDPVKLLLVPDPVRNAAGLPLGDDGEFFVGFPENMGQGNTPDVIDSNSPPRTQPGLWCQWIPDESGSTLAWDQGEKFYEYAEWLEYLLDKLLTPWGYSLAGQVTWQGEDSSDMGRLIIDSPSNKLTVQRAVITYS